MLKKFFPITVASLVVAGAAQAATLSGGNFEAGLDDWTVAGSVITSDGSDFGGSVLEGAQSALLSNGDGSISDTEIETIMGIAPGTLDDLAINNGVQNSEATEGSVISQTFDVILGQVLSFTYQILANDCPETGIPNCSSVEDGAFFSISQGSVVDFLIGTSDASMVESDTNFVAESGIKTFAHEFTQSGAVTFSVALLDFSDTIVDSALLVDNVVLSDANVAPIPLPATGLLLIGGLGALALRRKTY